MELQHSATAAGCLGFGLLWAGGAAVVCVWGGWGPESSVALQGTQRLARSDLGGQEEVPGWGLEVEECWGVIARGLKPLQFPWSILPAKLVVQVQRIMTLYELRPLRPV